MIMPDQAVLTRTLFCVGTMLLVGCVGVIPDSPESYPAKQALMGQTKQALLACAGQPGVQRSSSGDELIFVYYREASQFEESFGGSKSSFATVHHGCRATITLEQDRVTKVQYASEPASYRDEDHCEDIFEPCLSP